MSLGLLIISAYPTEAFCRVRHDAIFPDPNAGLPGIPPAAGLGVTLPPRLPGAPRAPAPPGEPALRLRPYRQAVASPNGGATCERRALMARFEDRIFVDPTLTRRAVSFQGNRQLPGFRWMKYKEGFSADLVESLLAEAQPESVLDPFAGLGTAPLIAAGRGLCATGIEIMPVGARAAQAIVRAANDLDRGAFRRAGARLVKQVETGGPAPSRHAFPHVPITQRAFPEETEAALARARQFLAAMRNRELARLLDFACMSVLESVSYTRKDGQYLRWDYRSGRPLKSRVDKGTILPFAEALAERLRQMDTDIPALRTLYGGGAPTLVLGSSLERLQDLPGDSVDLVITSPPYANRYDYTRTYALELAWLGYDRERFSDLRQDMLSATVENRSKERRLLDSYGDPALVRSALRMFREQGGVREVADILRDHRDELGNPQVIRLIEGYFLEMAVVICELSRVVRSGGVVAMVNDNVQYHGEEAPVDLILADFAEQVGFACESIRVLPRGKGNASQQMGRFGRREIRKCVYRWVRT